MPERAPAGDVLVSPRAASLDALPAGATIGTGSLRRRTQLLHFRRDLQMKDIRGNVDTRLRKLAEGAYDALVLAEAGLRRLGLEGHIAQVLPWEIVLPAPGQGAMALQARADDEPTRRIAAELDHLSTRAAVTAERALLAALQGGCLAPIAALGRVEGERLTLVGRVLGRDGARRIEAADSAPPAEAIALGRHVADALLTQGAGELIRAAREGSG